MLEAISSLISGSRTNLHEATKGLHPETQLKETRLRKYFSFFTFPSKYAYLRELFTDNHQTPANIQHRAIASYFHPLQDSYTHEHMRRILLSPED